MRASEAYKSVTSSAEMRRLAEKYMIQGTLAEQDWLTMLGWEMEDMFYLLPCQFNVQITDYREEYKDVWDSYHKCDTNTEILHVNGE
jgi:hypothetical protein